MLFSLRVPRLALFIFTNLFLFISNFAGLMIVIFALQVTREVIQAVENVGFFVRACISDMGSANQDMWKCVGIHSRRDNLTNSVTHPIREGCRLYFMADPPHLLKNIRNCLLPQNILLPNEVVRINSLPSNIVSIQHVRDLIALQEGMELKLHPHFHCH